MPEKFNFSGSDTHYKLFQACVCCLDQARVLQLGTLGQLNNHFCTQILSEKSMPEWEFHRNFMSFFFFFFFFPTFFLFLISFVSFHSVIGCIGYKSHIWVRLTFKTWNLIYTHTHPLLLINKRLNRFFLQAEVNVYIGFRVLKVRCTPPYRNGAHHKVEGKKCLLKLSFGKKRKKTICWVA